MSDSRYPFIEAARDGAMTVFIANLLQTSDIREQYAALHQFYLTFLLTSRYAEVEGGDVILPIIDYLLTNDTETLKKLQPILKKLLDEIDWDNQGIVLLTHISAISQVKLDDSSASCNENDEDESNIRKHVNRFIEQYNNPVTQAAIQHRIEIINHIEQCIALINQKNPDPKIAAAKSAALITAHNQILNIHKQPADILESLNQAKTANISDQSLYEMIAQIINLVIAFFSRDHKAKNEILADMGLRKQFSSLFCISENAAIQTAAKNKPKS